MRQKKLPTIVQVVGTLNASTMSWGLSKSIIIVISLHDNLTYQTVCVMAVPAEGAMQFAKMLYFLPSIARVRVRPMIPAFAVEY